MIRAAAGFAVGLVVGTFLGWSSEDPAVADVPDVVEAIEADDPVDVRPWQDDLVVVERDPEDEARELAEAQCAIDVLNGLAVELTAASVIVQGYWSDLAYGGPCEHKEALWPNG
jgi:hypothetical protein